MSRNVIDASIAYEKSRAEFYNATGVQGVVNHLIERLGVDITQMHLNMCIACRRASRDAIDARIMINDYLAIQLGHIIRFEDAMLINDSILNMDTGIVSITL